MHAIPRRAGLAGAAAAALVGLAAIPAAAEPGPDPTIVFVPDVTVAAGGPTKVVAVGAVFATPVATHAITVDFTGVADFAEIAPADDVGLYDCEAAGTVITCSSDDPDPSEFGFLPISVAAGAGAATGDSGPIIVTASAPGVDEASYQATVTVGTGVDLDAGEPVTRTAAPGDPVQVPMTLRNAGTTDVHGVVGALFVDPMLAPAKRYSNCSYDALGLPGLAVCTFDTTLKPATLYTLSEPLGFVVAEDTWAPSARFGDIEWFTPADWAELTSAPNGFEPAPGTPGTDGPLRLEQAVSLLSSPETDVDPMNNFTGFEVSVTGDNRADFAAVGDTASGRAGEDVELTLGIRDLGPAALDAYAPFRTLALVTLPPGTTAAAWSEFCFSTADLGRSGTAPAAAGPDDPLDADLVCEPLQTIKAGETMAFDVTLTIDEVIPDATGEVTLLHLDGDLEPTADLNPDNDTAPIAVNATSGGGGTGGAAGGGEEGAGLPITGASTGWMAGVGAALLTLGAAGLLAVRRRRIRFTA